MRIESIAHLPRRVIAAAAALAFATLLTLSPGDAGASGNGSVAGNLVDVGFVTAPDHAGEPTGLIVTGRIPGIYGVVAK